MSHFLCIVILKKGHIFYVILKKVTFLCNLKMSHFYVTNYWNRNCKMSNFWEHKTPSTNIKNVMLSEREWGKDTLVDPIQGSKAINGRDLVSVIVVREGEGESMKCILWVW